MTTLISDHEIEGAVLQRGARKTAVRIEEAMSRRLRGLDSAEGSDRSRDGVDTVRTHLARSLP